MTDHQRFQIAVAWGWVCGRQAVPRLSLQGFSVSVRAGLARSLPANLRMPLLLGELEDLAARLLTRSFGRTRGAVPTNPFDLQIGPVQMSHGSCRAQKQELLGNGGMLGTMKSSIPGVKVSDPALHQAGASQSLCHPGDIISEGCEELA